MKADRLPAPGLDGGAVVEQSVRPAPIDGGEPVVDVVIPVFNCEATVAAAIDSICAQTVRGINIIVVDDGSTDGTLAVVRAIAAVDARVQVIAKSNSGIVDALNVGLSHCTATFVARHDGDDLAYPHRFEKQLAYLRAHPDCSAVGAHARLIDETGRPTGGFSRAPPPDEADPFHVPAREPYLLHPFLMARFAAIHAVGGYRHNMLAEDSDLYWRLQEQGGLHNLPELLGDYRVHGNSTTSRSIARGRINALFSELAAISAQRRRGGRPDLVFTAAFASHVGSLAGIEQVFAAGAECVEPAERGWLQIAMAAKLVELGFIRRYPLELEDCRFVRRAFDQGWGSLDAAGRASNAERLTQLAKRLVEQGQFASALAAIPTHLRARVTRRIAFRWLLPGVLRDRVKRIAGRATRP